MHACAIQSPLGNRGLEHALPRERCPSAVGKKTGETWYRLGSVLNSLHNKHQSRLETYGGSRYGRYFSHKGYPYGCEASANRSVGQTLISLLLQTGHVID